MSATASKWAWSVQDNPATAVSPPAHHVLLCLVDRYNARYHEAWPSYSDIVKRTGLSERTVRRGIEELELRGLVIRRPRVSRSGRKIGLRYRFPAFDFDHDREMESYRFGSDGRFDSDEAEIQRAEGWSA